MDDNNNIKKASNVPPFLRYCSAIIPTAFDDSLSYYEALCALYKFLQGQVINTINNNANVTQHYIDRQNELEALFEQLKEYVDNYFDNLDVQEEINNKLDAMVEDGTLEELLNSYSTLQYIFPKHENESYSTWGDISLLKFEDRVICIDTGLDDRWSEIYLMLSSNNITHIDRLIITHYHNDHINNLQNLISAGFLTSTSLVYLCGDVEDWAEIVTTQTYVKTLLTNNDIPYTNPEEGDIVDYNGLTLQFNNIANLDDLYYSAGDYNACSMCVGITYKNHKSLFTGDATDATLAHLHDLNVDKEKVDLYKIGHHAIGQQTYKAFIDSIHPNIAVVIASITDSSNNMSAYNEECDIVERNGGLVYPTFSQDSYLIFETIGENARCTQGNPRNVASTIITNEIYVDASVDDDAVQDGSQDYPFNNIQQALGSQQNYLDVLTIHVASGTYIPINARSQKNIVKISGKKFGRVEIVGDTSHPENVIVQDVIVENANVKISGITIKTSESYYNGIVAKNSKVSLINVYIGDSTNPTHYASVIATTSELFFQNCEIAYQRNGIILNEASYAMIIDSTFDHITESFMSANNSHYNTKNITVTNSTPKYFPTRKNQNSSVIISNTEGDTSVTSTVPLSTFEYIKLTLRTNDYGAFAVEVPVGGSNRYYDAYTKFFGGDGSVFYEKCARITINPSDNTISISRRHDIATTVSTGVSTYSTPDHNFYFVKIEGVFSTID